ncbi:MAG: hypothetical protein ACI9FD_003090, partial [Gammaproteobacteria bacterium]
MASRVVENMSHFYESGKVVRHGLPGSAYTDPGFFRDEQENVLSRHWAFAGFAHEIP